MPSSAESKRQRRIAARWPFASDAVRPAIAAFALALICLIWVGAHFLAVQDRARTLGEVRTNLANLTRALAEHTAHSLDYAAQLSLQLKRQYERLGARLDLPKYMADAQINTELVRNAVVSDAHGDVVLSSMVPLVRANLADREHVRVHRERDSGEVVIGKPVRARVGGQWTIVVTRRANRPDGSFAGVIHVALNPFYFSNFYRQVDLGSKSAVGLFGRDGTVRALSLQGEEVRDLGQDVRAGELFKNLSAAPHGTMTVATQIDGVRRIVSYRSLKDYPLVVAVGVAEEVAFADAERRRRLYQRVSVIASLSIMAMAAWLIVLLTRQRRAAEVAEHARLARMVELRDSHERLREHDARYRAAVETSTDGFLVTDARGRVLDVNEAYVRRSGYAREELLGMQLAQLAASLSPEQLLDLGRRVIAQGGQIVEGAHRSKDGAVWPVEVSLTYVPHGGGQFMSFVRDISGRRRAEQALRQSDARLRQAVRVSDIGILDHDHFRDTIYWSPELRRIYGIGADEVVTLPGIIGHLHAEDRERIAAAVRRAHDPSGDGLFDVEHRIVRRDGEIRWLATRSQTVFEGEGDKRRPLRTVGAVIDFTERKRTEEELRRARDSIEVANCELQRALEREQVVARTDGLTGLPNRILFQDRLQQAIASAARDPGRRVAVLLMDLDNFKEINDTLGHPAGDRVLVQIAQRLAGELRDEDTITRMGGDEFAVLLPALNAPAQGATQVAHKLLAALASPVLYEDRELHVGASVGISLHPEHGADAATLVARADVAMYASKARRAGPLFYDPAMDSGVSARLQLSNELLHAIERRELFLEFQPKIDLASGRVVGAEALVRWRHPSSGCIAPADFVPLAERSGLIHSLTDWVTRNAVERCREWRASGHDLHVAVNISGRTLFDPGFADRVLHTLAAAGLPAHCLELEITESTVMADIENAGRLLDRLYARGVRISIDDFGTGYSSLAYLKRLPLHALKIDQSFVRDMAQDANDAAIVRSIIDLAHNLGRSAVAEGVEDARALELLRTYGCDSGQGFYLGRPVADDQFGAWLSARQTR
jgi:diguanylate cyclase (GGDEF)-like protein/PAS domain S-box-containing protein